MSFARQVWWSRRIGLLLAALGVLLALVLPAPAEGGLPRDAARALTAAGLVGGIGGIVRPVQRWWALKIELPSTLFSPRGKRIRRWGRLGEWWLRLDDQGRDREADHG